MPSVLYVDDSHLGRTLARLTFAKAGWGIIEATDGIAALEAAEAYKPACIVLSVPTPALDAMTLLRRLKGLQTGTSIVVLASRARSETIEAFRSAGATQVAEKSSAAQTLAQIVEGVLTKKNRAAA